FVLFLMAASGWHFSSGDEDGGSYYSREDAALAKATGHYFYRYLIFVCVSYAGMAFKRVAGQKTRALMRWLPWGGAAGKRPLDTELLRQRLEDAQSLTTAYSRV